MSYEEDVQTEESWLSTGVKEGNTVLCLEALRMRLRRPGASPGSVTTALNSIERASNVRDDYVSETATAIVGAVRRLNLAKALRLARELQRVGIR